MRYSILLALVAVGCVDDARTETVKSTPPTIVLATEPSVKNSTALALKAVTAKPDPEKILAESQAKAEAEQAALRKKSEALNSKLQTQLAAGEKICAKMINSINLISSTMDQKYVGVLAWETGAYSRQAKRIKLTMSNMERSSVEHTAATKRALFSAEVMNNTMLRIEAEAEKKIERMLRDRR